MSISGIYLFLLLFCSTSYIANAQQEDSILIAPNSSFKNNVIHNIIFGKHYRAVWSTPVKSAIFTTSLQNNLTPIKAGGNFQTKSVRLRNTNEKEFVIRSIRKDPARALPKLLKSTPIAGMLRDQNSAENPYGAIILPTLADAIGILCTKPSLYFIDSTSGLGSYEAAIRNEMVMLEMRPDGDMSDEKNFGYAEKISSTKTVFRKKYEDIDNVIDERLFAKTRLFDMLIADWGRHEDQWKWAATDLPTGNIYKPIPRDRDHAFYKFNDGILPWITGKLVQPKLQSFNKSFGNISGLNKSAEFLDHRLLTSISEKDWIEVAESIKLTLTDNVIDSAVLKFPKEVHHLLCSQTAETLKVRRDQLTDVAKRYSQQLAKVVQITGAAKEEGFEVTFLPGRKTLVKVIKLKKDSSENKVYFERIFTKYTKQIILRGFEGDDEYIFRNTHLKSVKVLIVDNQGNNKFEDFNSKKSKEGKIKVITSQNIESTKVLKYKKPKRQAELYFDKEGFKRKVSEE